MDTLEAQVLNLFKLPIEERNQLIDVAFDDTEALTPRERAGLSPLIDLKGTIVVVPPRGAGRAIRPYPNALRFMLKEGNTVGAIAVAGVGSSVLGTAALARTVADCYGIDVAGIATGYGLSDLLVEALGGWFVYGQIDRFRHAADLVAEKLLHPPPQAAENLEPGVTVLFVATGNSDVGTLLDVLLARPKNLRLLVGHSKGNLLISYALNHMVDEMGGEHHPLYDELAVVTLGAVVGLPNEFERQHQFLGEYDWFGALNSELDVAHRKVPRAWHHLNPRVPFCLSVPEILRDVPLPEGRENRPMAQPWGDWSPAGGSRPATPEGGTEEPVDTPFS
jgi:hypothetical protein